MNQQNSMALNEVYPPPNNTSTPFQPQNHNPPLALQQNELGPNDIVIQHLQLQALNQTQLNVKLGSILSHQHHQVLSAHSRLNVMDLCFSLLSAFLIHSL